MAISAETRLQETRMVFIPERGIFLEKRPESKFIRGPIPFDWMKRANKLGGKVGAVGLALWFLSGLRKSKDFKITGEVEELAAVDRKTLYRALEALESSGLISLRRLEGARPIVTLLQGESNSTELVQA